ncbi:DNA mismatch repair endonuclease MutL [bacterium]|jgi:DNA mismatch repair protein MutL|nr:DNA mismatch repair endonuclease MutL [bacterium]
MSHIKKLPIEEAQKIAAGEVIERPANVVKELVENSIDAQSTAISIYIEASGKGLIRIVDNGTGMSEEDAKICFLKYTTSKIGNIEDLETLTTFGFRGEAIASICTVSHTKIKTKNKKSDAGTEFSIENNTIANKTTVSCQQGTDISVANLFYNLPARLKFLKKDETEWRHITQLFQAFCLSNTDIHFKLFRDENLIYNCPPTQDIKNRCAQVWEHTQGSQILPLAENRNKEYQVSGAITHYHYGRYDKSCILFFVNNRLIRNNKLARSLLKGYEHALYYGKFPAAAIFVEVDPSLIDVNVHPRKEEILFTRPRSLEILIQNSVKQTLELYVSEQIKTNPAQQNSTFSNSISQAQSLPQHNNQPKTLYPGMPQATFSSRPTEQPIRMKDSFAQESKTNNQPKEENLSISPETSSDVHYEIIGQYKRTFILIDRPNGLIVIDQHSAHERILYEEFLEKLDQNVATIALAFPQIISLSTTDLKILTPYLDLFKNNGIVLEQMGEGKLAVQATPVHLKNVSIQELVNETIGFITESQGLEHEDIRTILLRKLVAQMACKAAIKAGDKLTTEQMLKLVENLKHAKNRFCCPHGRPTSWLLEHHEIEKKFKRDYKQAAWK